jgi:hypothetical protein
LPIENAEPRSRGKLDFPKAAGLGKKIWQDMNVDAYLPYLFHFPQLPFQQLPILGSPCTVKIQFDSSFDFPFHPLFPNYHKNLRSSAIFPPFWRMRRLQKAI